MRIVKIGALCVLALWMGYLTLRVEHVHRMAKSACAFAFAAYKNRDNDKGISWNQSDCPWWIGEFSTPLQLQPKALNQQQ